VSGWWSEKFADFRLTVTPDLTMDVTSVSKGTLVVEVTPSLTMEATGQSVGDFTVTLAPNVAFQGEQFRGVFALNFEPQIGMAAAGRSVADFTLTVTPALTFVGGEHYTAAFAVTVSPSIGATAYIKQLPHPIPWTL